MAECRPKNAWWLAPSMFSLYKFYTSKMQFCQKYREKLLSFYLKNECFFRKIHFQHRKTLNEFCHLQVCVILGSGMAFGKF